MPKIDKYTLGEVRYCDCLNPINGLSTLPDKSFDLGLADFPYNLDQKKSFISLQHRKRPRTTAKFYEDNLPENDYKNWCYSVFDELKRVCHGVIFTPGYKNREIWFDRKEKFEIIIWFNSYRRGATPAAMHNVFEMFFCWGKFNRRFATSGIHYNYGFNHVYDYKKIIHPHPKALKVYKWIIKSTQPKSVIDPLLGSGTTAEACTKFGIPWLGYEINEAYSQDINMRLKKCKPEPKQITLF